jgi:hypothetical protein
LGGRPVRHQEGRPRTSLGLAAVDPFRGVGEERLKKVLHAHTTT